MMKISIKYLVLSILVIFAFAYYILHTTNYQLPTTFAQLPSECATPSGTEPARVIDGLVATPQIQSGSQFYTSAGKCAVDPKTVFAPFKIPTYDDLKSQFYTQSKANKVEVTGTTLPLPITDNTVYFRNGDLTIPPFGSPWGSGTALVFVEGNLFINTNITYGTSQTGLVFVVKGNVNIIPEGTGPVTTINALIISSGTICTAYDTSLGICPATSVSASQLTINGSLISLDSTKPPKFRRILSDNTQPAEKIIHQVKYLVILRNLFSQTLQKWSEVVGPVSLPSPPPFDFSLANEGDKTLAQGSSVANTTTATLSSGTARSVAFSVSGLPAGVTSSFSPISCIPTCTSTLTLTASSDATIGTSTITVKAEGIGITKTTNFVLTVSACGPAVIGPSLVIDSARCI